MQRWIALAVLGFLVLAGGMTGAWFAYKNYKQSRPAPIWVPIPITAELPDEQRKKLVEDVKSKLQDPALLTKVSQDLDLKTKLGLASDELCVKEMQRRMFVRTGTADSPMGKVPSLNIGFNGKVKERSNTTAMAECLMDDVWPILGIDPPPKR